MILLLDQRTLRENFARVSNTKHQPTHEHDFYHLAAAWTDLKAGYAILSYSRSEKIPAPKTLIPGQQRTAAHPAVRFFKLDTVFWRYSPVV